MIQNLRKQAFLCSLHTLLSAKKFLFPYIPRNPFLLQFSPVRRPLWLFLVVLLLLLFDDDEMVVCGGGWDASRKKMYWANNVLLVFSHFGLAIHMKEDDKIIMTHA